MNPDTIGYVWTGEFDLNTLRVDGEIFESGKKKLRIQIYPDTCGQGLRCLNVIAPKYRPLVFYFGAVIVHRNLSEQYRRLTNRQERMISLSFLLK